MTEKFTKERAQQFAENMLDAETSYPEVVALLKQQGFTQYEAEEISKPFFFTKIKKLVRKQKIISVVLLAVILTLIGLYIYGENENKNFAEMQMTKGKGVLNKDGTYTIIGHFESFDFIMKTAVWCAIGLAYTLIRLLLNYKTLKLYK